MIPLYIINFNRLEYVKQLLAYVEKLRDVEPIIIDNQSTYPPLLEWYEQCPVDIVHMDHNDGPRAAWSGCVDLQRSKYFAVTDPDIDLSGVPKDVMDLLQDGLEHEDVEKCGVSLRIDDLPDTTMGIRARTHEAGFWVDRRDEWFFNAEIDTTFALYRSSRPGFVYGPALRTDWPYIARHLPWYITEETATDEDRYYWQHLDKPMYVTWSRELRSEFSK